MGRLGGKTAVITGAGSGIGLAATQLFAAEGASVLAIDLDDAHLAAALKAGDRVSGFAADVTDSDAVQQAMLAAVDRYGGIDILLPNAGIWGTVAVLEAYPLETFRRVIEVNLTSVFITMKHALPHMVKRGGGSIVMTSSIAGIQATPANVAYAAAKHAIVGMMRSTALEYGPMGIRVNTVNPGVIDTPMMRELERTFSPDDPEAGAENLKGKNLFGRYGSPDEVAKLMLYLASDDAQYCTGGIYTIDGGMQVA